MDEGPDRLDQALGLAIRLRRHAKGLSQSALGEAIGVSFQQVQKYERGSNRVSFSTMVRICEALGCHVSDLVAEVEELGEAANVDGGPHEPLTQPEAGPMLEALSQIRSAGLRRAVLELARSLARDS
jgi:transcriptional regulator with XRE-family HTH domain